MSFNLALFERGKFLHSRSYAAVILPVFTSAIFTSAFLLFAVQPMFTKMVLPRLGGTPAVWSIAMVFFQGLLLLGYLYAHFSGKWLSLRQSVLLHIGLLLATLFALPISLHPDLGNPPAEGEALWLIGVFTACVGLPFFAVAGNGPLLQSWFSRTGHPHAADPYFLYGASNFGSFLALLLYPALFEPTLTLGEQSRYWTIGFFALTCIIALCGAFLLQIARAPTESAQSQSPISYGAPSWRDRLAWIGYAFVPSGLLIAVTAYISTNVASAPFLWIIPLALFLLTFVLVFREKAIIPHSFIVKAWPIFAVALIIASMGVPLPTTATLSLHIVGFAVAALLCHGELFQRRPKPAHLTEFYLWMSAGGVLGGLFTGLVSPHVFNNIYEYPILISLAILCLPGSSVSWKRQLSESAVLLFCIGAVFLLLQTAKTHAPSFYGAVSVSILVGGPLLTWLWRQHPLRAALVAASVLILQHFAGHGPDTLFQARSFFGVNFVRNIQNDELRVIVHGDTIHGAVRVKNAEGSPHLGTPVPITYYYAGGPYDVAIKAAREANGGRFANVAIAGLGAGGLACLAKPEEAWSFFEIDPDVIRIARNPSLFNFLSACTPNARIVQGDARLTIAQETQKFDLIALDAFSSDAIPVHLLTREAIELYLTKLTDHGVIVLNITNRHIELRPVLASIARDLGIVGFAKKESIDEARANGSTDLVAGTHIVALARTSETLRVLQNTQSWSQLSAKATHASWTDDYSNIIGALLRR